MVEYITTLDKINNYDLNGFFVDWPNPPDEETLIKIFTKSYRVVLAIEDKRLVGFINAISDGVLSAYIPLLEVLPEYQKKGIGKSLVQKMIAELKNIYMIDLLCDEEMISFYQKFDMQKVVGMCLRNYDMLSGLR